MVAANGVPINERPAQDELYLIFSRLRAPGELIQDLWQLLSLDERERANRFRFEKHRSDFVVARGLLRIILGRCVGIEAANIQFDYGAHGKPTLSDHPRISFNLSHSEDLVVYAIGSGQQLGVDLESVRTLEDMSQVAQSYFCSAEHREFLGVPEALRARAFFNCWTRKEAFVKAVGQGLSYPLHRFQVTLQPGQPAEFVHIDGRPGSQTVWSLYDAMPSDTYAAALAVKSRISHVRSWRFENPSECATVCRAA